MLSLFLPLMLLTNHSAIPSAELATLVVQTAPASPESPPTESNPQLTGHSGDHPKPPQGSRPKPQSSSTQSSPVSETTTGDQTTATQSPRHPSTPSSSDATHVRKAGEPSGMRSEDRSDHRSSYQPRHHSEDPAGNRPGHRSGHHSGRQPGHHAGKPRCKFCLKHRGSKPGPHTGKHGCKRCRSHGGGNQYHDGKPHASYRRPSWGGFGYTTAGILFGDWGGYRKSIVHASGTELDHAKAAYLIGGGGAMLVGGRYLIGGKGYGIFSPLIEADWGKAALTGGGGGLDVGLVLINRRRWLVYPKAGFGGQEHTLIIRNSSNTNLRFGSGASPIAANSDEQFTTGFFTADIGIGFQRLIFPRADGGGLVNGGEVGVMMSLSEGAWTDSDDATVRGAPPMRMIALYLRLNLGGGGFTWTKFAEK